MDELPPDDRERYFDLAVFPEDESIPEGPLQMLWSLTPPKTRFCMDRLAARSLASIQQVGGKTALLLHDLQADYIGKQREQQLPALNTRLLDAYSAQCEIRNPHSEIRNRTNWPQGPDDGYFFQRLAWHLSQTGRKVELRGLLFDFNWLQVKLDATDVTALIADYDHLQGDRELQSLQGAIQLSAHVLARNKRGLAGQLIGRLCAPGTAAMKAFLKQASSDKPWPWLRPLGPSLTPSDGYLVRTLVGHTDDVSAVAVTSDGRWALSGSSTDLCFWDLKNGERIHLLHTRTNMGVLATALSEDARWGLSASDKVYLWDLVSGKLVRTFDALESTWVSVSFTPDGRGVLAGSSVGTLLLWDLASGHTVHELKGHQDGANAFAVTLDGQWAVSGSSDLTVGVWSLAAGEMLTRLEGHTHAVMAVALTSDRKWAVSGGYDSTVRFWNLDERKLVKTFEGHTGIVKCVAITPDGQFIISGANDSTVRLWDVTLGKATRVYEVYMEWVTAMTITPDGRRIISGSRDGKLRLWDLSPHRTKRSQGHHSNVIVVAMSGDGLRSFSGSSSGMLKLWDLKHVKSVRTLEASRAGLRSLLVMALTPAWKRVIAGSFDGQLLLWNLGAGKTEHILRRSKAAVSALAVSSDGLRGISGHPNGALQLWDLDCRKRLVEVRGHADLVKAVAMTPDGSRAVSGARDGTLMWWDVKRTMRAHRLDAEKTDYKGVVAVSITPDGQWAAVGRWNGTLELWNLQSGKKTCILEGFWNITSVALTADASRAVIAWARGTLQVWDLKNRREIAVFTGDSVLGCCTVGLDALTIVAGEESGNVHFLRLEGVR